MMDHTYDYLLPTCMLKRQTIGKNESVAIETRPGIMLHMDSIFDDTINVLEEDTCSEISDRSYADASYYTRMKLWKSPYLEQQFYSDTEDVAQITKDPPTSSSQFDLSLRQFLEWPDSDSDTSVPDVCHSEVTRTRRKATEKRKRPTRIHNMSHSLTSQKRSAVSKVTLESDSDFSPQSEEEVFKNDDVDKTVMSFSTDNGSAKQPINTLSRKPNKTIDSDSDYRTYSDTSSEKLETNIAFRTSTSHKEVDLTPLQTLMSTVLEKSENISNRLQQNYNLGSKTERKICHKKSSTSPSGLKCEEMEHFKTLLIQAKERLTQSETAVESLQSQLLDEKFIGKGTMEAQIKQLQEEVADLKGKLQEKTKERDNTYVDIETVARQLGVVNRNSENMLEEILAEIQTLQNATVSSAHPPTPSHKHANKNSTSRRHFSPSTGNLHDNGDQPNSQDGNTDGSHVEMSDAVPMSCDTVSDAVTQHEVADLTAQINDLKMTLKATEETVHSQTYKMKHYRNILYDNGLLLPPAVARSRSNSVPASMINSYRAWISEAKLSKRSNSVDNHTYAQRSLRRNSVDNPTYAQRSQRRNSVDNPTYEQRSQRRNSVDNLTYEQRSQRRNSVDNSTYEQRSQRRNSVDYPTYQLRRGSVSPTPKSRRQLSTYTLNESAEDTEKLFKENSKLKQQISGYRRVLRVFQVKNSMSGSESVVSTESSSMCVESAQCYLECWLGMVDKFLSQLSESDDDLLYHSGITIDVNRLKKGLIEAKGAVQTLSDSCGAVEKCNEGQLSSDEGRLSSDEGRLSPDTSDSGCSVIFASAQKTMKECQLNTDVERHSTVNSQRLSPISDTAVDSHRLCPMSDTDQPLVKSDSHSTHQNGSLLNPRITAGSWLTVCMNDGQSEAGSYAHDHYCNETLNSAFSEPICCKCSRDIVRCSSRESRSEMCVPDTSNVGTEHNHCQVETQVLDHHCKDIDHRCKNIDLTCCCQSQNETDSNKSRRCSNSNMSIKLLQNHSECAAELQHQMKSLGKVIQSYEEQIQKHFRADVNTVLQDQLNELGDLRVVLEQNINRNGVLEKMIKDWTSSSEKTIQDLTAQLVQCNKVNQQQVEDTECKSNLNLEICRDNSCKTNAEVELFQKRVASLEIELKAKKVEVDQLRTKCQQQESVVDYYNKVDKEISSNTAREEVKENNENVECLKAELERSRDTIDEQSLHLCDKTREIDGLKCEIKKQNVILREQDKLCRELTSKLEGLNAANEKVSTQLEFDKHHRDYYKLQNDKQTQLIQQLKDRMAKLKADLTLSVQMRNSLDKMMAQEKKATYEATKLKDKYLYNLKVTYRELSKAKKDVRDEHRKYEEISSVTRSLQTELKVRTQLMNKKGDLQTDDDKQTMITELLKELHQLREQVTTILEQNKNMKAKLTQYCQHTKTKGQKQSSNIKSSVHEENVDKIKKLREEARRYNTRHGVSTAIHEPSSRYPDEGSTEDIRPSIAGLPVIRVTMVS